MSRTDGCCCLFHQLTLELVSSSFKSDLLAPDDNFLETLKQRIKMKVFQKRLLSERTIPKLETIRKCESQAYTRAQD